MKAPEHEQRLIVPFLCIDGAPTYEISKTYVLTSDEFDAMYGNGLLDEIMSHYNVYLDEFESGFAGGDVDYLLRVAEDNLEDCPAFYQAALEAKKHGTGVFFGL